MTIGSPEFDGDSHTRKENWFLNDSVVRGALPSPNSILPACRGKRVCLYCNVHIGFSQLNDKLEFDMPSNFRSLRTSPQTGVAISWIGVQFLVDEFRKTAQKGQSV